LENNYLKVFSTWKIFRKKGGASVLLKGQSAFESKKHPAKNNSGEGMSYGPDRPVLLKINNPFCYTF
jgi:hypothetical protein